VQALPRRGEQACNRGRQQEQLSQRGEWLLLLILLYRLAAFLALAASLVGVSLGREACLSIVFCGLLSLLLCLLVNILMLLTDGRHFWNPGGGPPWTARGRWRKFLTGALYLLLVIMPLVYLRQATRHYLDARGGTLGRALQQIWRGQRASQRLAFGVGGSILLLLCALCSCLAGMLGQSIIQASMSPASPTVPAENRPVSLAASPTAGSTVTASSATPTPTTARKPGATVAPTRAPTPTPSPYTITYPYAYTITYTITDTHTDTHAFTCPH
jgi:hypothetical protein